MISHRYPHLQMRRPRFRDVKSRSSSRKPQRDEASLSFQVYLTPQTLPFQFRQLSWYRESAGESQEERLDGIPRHEQQPPPAMIDRASFKNKVLRYFLSRNDVVLVKPPF